MKFFKQKNINESFNKITLLFLIIVIATSVCLPRETKAVFPVADTPKFIKDAIVDAWWMLNDVMDKLWEAGGSKAINSATRYALQKIAYESATWLASGDKGQKPKYFTEGFGGFVSNIGDAALGEFIESMGKSGILGYEFNLCEPDLNVKVSIGLGLVPPNKAKLKGPECTFSKMRDNWEKALEDPKFLNNVQSMFEPTSNDLGIALTLNQEMWAKKDAAVDAAVKNRQEGQGYNEFDSFISGKKTGVPGASAQTNAGITNAMFNFLSLDTANPFVDAANTFLNQYALIKFQKMMASLTKKGGSLTSPYAGDYGGLTKKDSQANTSSSGGATAVQKKMSQIIEPTFTESGNIDILADLAICNNAAKAGPTNCVISDKFAEAVRNNKTVGQAMTEGYLDPQGVFGFLSTGQEPAYNQGYPYRSMIILRKYRIIPVGWELAAQQINTSNAAGNTNVLNLGDLVACYSDSDDYEGFYDSWCRGLVDPSWVLKAPQNFCKKKGPGPEITSSQVIEKMTSETVKWNELMVTRNENYCADEQACVKENKDGTCKLYGYCTEEKRKWKFDTDSCEANYNTCQSYESSDGKAVAYLANTLNYGTCSVDNAGCKAYSYSFTNYAANTDKVTWTNSHVLYLDNDIETCDQEDEGCHAFIRNKDGLGTNLLVNGSFEDNNVSAAPLALSNGATGNIDEWTSFAHAGENVSVSIVDTSGTNKVHSGERSLYIDGGTGSGIIPHFNMVLPRDYFIDTGEVYTLSAWVYVVNPGGMLMIGIGDGTNWEGTATTTTTGGWELLKTTVVKSVINWDQFFIYTNTGPTQAYIDDMKLEKGQSTTGYSSYKNNELVYEKLMPEYLRSQCYADSNGDNFLEKVSGAPAACDDYARLCTAREAGCDMYTPADGIGVPAKVKTGDYCPSECLGFDNYLQGETYFENSQLENFIPKTATKCNASVAGCDEFTNLDTLSKGGESREYYSFLKQCRLPDGLCEEFYTWEGNSESGYQLKVFNLQRVDPIIDAVTGPEPYVTSMNYEGMECNDAADYDLINNPNCREFYNKNGSVFYRFLPLTVTCSENCKPFRRTISDNPGVNNCKNGGNWDANSSSCIYMAIPGEGTKCSAAQAGCREYSGSAGNNVNVIMLADFESSAYNWNSGSFSPESLVVGGHSLLENSPTPRTSVLLGDSFNTSASYSLKFLAKSTTNSPITITARIANNTEQTVFDGSALASGDWQIFKLNLASLDHEVINAEESLVIESTGSFFIDNVQLTEITDHYYLIKDSWQMPIVDGKDICNWNLITDKAEALYSLGCEQYTDRSKKKVNLHQFSELCQDSAVGCEQMIDTHNSADYREVYYHDLNNDSNCTLADTNGCLSVPADNFIYAVYDEDKKCNNEDKGCQRLGAQTDYEDQHTYEDVYYKNDPDKYSTTMCLESENGCAEWNTGDSKVYFKDPANQICEWRQKADSDEKGWGWYRKKIKRCDINPNGIIDNNDGADIPVCSVDDDCPTTDPATKCIIDNRDFNCTLDYLKTVGLGGVNLRVGQPGYDTGTGAYWAGTCPIDQSGCTEYIEPISSFSANVVKNPNFEEIDGNPLTTDKWRGPVTGPFEQRLGLQQYTLYRLAGKNIGADRTVTLTCPPTIPPAPDPNLYMLDSTTNELVDTNNTRTLNVVAGNNYSSVLIYTNGNSDCTLQTSGKMTDVQLKKVIIDYQLKADTKNDCNGLVNRTKGCILFNERSQNGGNKAVLSFSADQSQVENQTPANCVGDCPDSNVILKVSPDRDCAKWLACRSYTKDKKGQNVCTDLSLCEKTDDNGECNGFVITPALADPDYATNQTYNSVGTGNLTQDQISNLTGYSIVGYNYSDVDSPLGQKDLYPMSVMRQYGSATNDFNGSFETNTGNGGSANGWVGAHAVITDPKDIQANNASYLEDGFAPDGLAMISYTPSTQSPQSQAIFVSPNKTYAIGVFFNTSGLVSSNANDTAYAYLSINARNSSGNLVPVRGHENLIRAKEGLGWKYFVVEYVAPANTRYVEIILEGSAASSGKIYADKVSFSAGLRTKNYNSAFWYETESCRLYPKVDSPSCYYKEDTGMIQKGIYGYCLQYDRYPGSPDACLLWYPVDRTNGDLSGTFTNEVTTYSDRYPLYYCMSAGQPSCSMDASNLAQIRCTNLVKVVDDNGQNKIWNSRVQSNSTYRTLNANGSFVRYSLGGTNRLVGWSDNQYNYAADLSPYGGAVLPDNNPNTWGNQPIFVQNSSSGGYRASSPYQCNSSQDCYIITFLDGRTFFVDTLSFQMYFSAVCGNCGASLNGAGVSWGWNTYNLNIGDNTIVMYSDARGGSSGHGCCTNKLVSEIQTNGSTQIITRVANATDQALTHTNCDADGVDGDGGDCSEGHFSTTINASYSDRQECRINTDRNPSNVLQRLYSQTYGSWHWNGSSWVTDGSYYWQPPSNRCAGVGNQRPDCTTSNDMSCGDICGVWPEIGNMMVNGKTTSIVINESQYVNLTFTSKVDKDQLPITDVEINWGDGSTNAIYTNMSMRNRPDVANPHSFFHLYDYFTLTNNQGTPGSFITCGTTAQGIGYCDTRPSVRIMDNWDYGLNGHNDSATFYPFGNWIRVYAE